MLNLTPRAFCTKSRFALLSFLLPVLAQVIPEFDAVASVVDVVHPTVARHIVRPIEAVQNVIVLVFIEGDMET